METKEANEIQSELLKAAVTIIKSGKQHIPVLIINPRVGGASSIMAVDEIFGALGKQPGAAFLRHSFRNDRQITAVAFVDEAWAATFDKDMTREQIEKLLSDGTAVKDLDGAFELLLIQLETKEKMWLWQYRIERDDSGIRVIDTSVHGFDPTDQKPQTGEVDPKTVNNLRFLSLEPRIDT